MRASFGTLLSAILLALLPMVGACADDSEERETIVINIEGTWKLEATLNQDQGDLVCQISDLILTIQMQGNTQLFGGQSSGGQLSCTGGESSLEMQLPPLTIFNGTQDRGSEVDFELVEGSEGFQGDNAFLSLDGDLSATRMEGQIQGFIFLEELGPDATAFQGTFVNRRTST